VQTQLAHCAEATLVAEATSHASTDGKWVIEQFLNSRQMSDEQPTWVEFLHFQRNNPIVGAVWFKQFLHIVYLFVVLDN
jgi:hypothetical protein